jgi:hypothetical protein
MRTLVAAVAVAAMATLGTPALADHDALHLPTTDFLPPLNFDGPAEDRAEHCGTRGLRCLRHVEEQLAQWEAFFGCDHRAVFPTVYRMLTHEAIVQIEDDPDFFDDPAGIGWEAHLFYVLYWTAITSHLTGDPVPPAWQIAFEAANEGDWTAGHDMLLAISAHVQRDMPFAIAATGLALPDGESRKPDHDRMNVVLSRAYDLIVPEVEARYDPTMGTVDDTGGSGDDVGAQQLVAYWRERVWRNAENLVRSEGTPVYEFHVQAIEGEAETWARSITTGSEIPGHREVRDEYCRAQAAARGDTVAAPDAQPGDDHDEPQAGDRAGSDGQPLPATGGGVGVLGLLLAAATHRRTGRFKSQP